MRILGIVPARGGSKGIPRKNIAPLGGRPLIAYTADAARASRTLTRTILSTDDSEIADVGRQLGLEVPFLRPVELARDDSLAVDVIRHAVGFLEKHDGWRADAFLLLQPTSPLRRASHIDDAVRLLQETGADSVVSVIRVPHHFNPTSVMRMDNGQLTSFLPGPAVTRRQDKPVVYARNGPAVLLTRVTDPVAETPLYGRDCRPLVMHPCESLDIDNPADLEYAEYLLSRSAAA
ncbi:MAG: acylneuraminate cytidylyltransferase family protein [Pirellulaceae bacterium]